MERGYWWGEKIGMKKGVNSNKRQKNQETELFLKDRNVALYFPNLEGGGARDRRINIEPKSRTKILHVPWEIGIQRRQ